MATAKTRAKRTPKKRKDWKPAFLAAFEDTGMVTAACEVAQVGRRTVYDARQRDDKFAAAWADVEESTTEVMEREAFRRAVKGNTRVYYDHKGNVLREEQVYSDTLLIFMLKARRPATYRENGRIEITGDGGGPIQTQELIPSDADWHSQVANVIREAQAAANGAHPDKT